MNSLPSSSTSLQEKMAMKDHPEKPVLPPLVSSYNDRIRPLLDAVDRLRHLNVMEEGIELPTIVVVGDQSSGKSSVIESLAGISLPRGQGICTRVPLIMCLQNVPTDKPQMHLEYQGKIVLTSENQISDSISMATDEIAGNGKGISNIPLTLVVKKKGVPDLTIVDLPGITRVPVHGQPEDIYEQISNIIMDYIKPKESIILNVLSATVDFPTCESIRMSQHVDKTGERTLAVVTKADKAPEGLLEKVTADDVNIGLGYVCVRNRIGDETYEEARIEEATLFKSHPLLSKIDKSIVGIPVLAQKLFQIQANSLSQCLPDIVKKINDKLNKHVTDLNNMPQNLTNVAEATQAFMRVVGAAKESLKKVLLRVEFEDFPDDVKMHCTARMAEMLDGFYKDLQSKSSDNYSTSSCAFLMLEIGVLEESKWIGLPNFLQRTAFVALLQRKVNRIALGPLDFIQSILTYIEEVVIRIVSEHSEEYPQLQSMTKRAVHNLIDKMRDRSVKHVKEIIEMEKIADYTSNSDYVKTWSSLMENRKTFIEVIQDPNMGTKIMFQDFGEVEVGHLRQHSLSMLEQAFDMKMRLTAYWRLVLLRLVDSLALRLLFSVKKLVEREMEEEIVNELMGSHTCGIERMLEELPSTTQKCERLNKGIKLLRDSKDVVTKIMDGIAARHISD
ncbi:dynamin-related protein 4C-like [Magnolia sinica]|uniref:dynamin-related protein 4C-like n=1 Tax=Magnolia sinica TaxID=86752 RepID=UPI0026595B36|nr:dynamin-related protein 4C-like [Magnolia sinica]